ncbi:MAG: bifunctional proline dehydrogenase/L-glutamate gamma-semialdehyde dehydrogenase PutA [Burkholderiaceae bacterium]
MTDLRRAIRRATLADDKALLGAAVREANLSATDRLKICETAASLVSQVRNSSNTGIMESFLAEYGLSTGEGVALMCLAEALLRVPDNETVDALIRDKITPHDWAAHVGDSGSILINASTWALMLTGRVLDDEDPGVVGTLQAVVRRLGEPVVRVAVKRAMQELGSQFVLGQDIDQATNRGKAMVARGYTYSYDMLGEAARTAEDAQRYFDAYQAAIVALGKQVSAESAPAGMTSRTIRDSPGISVKLSALYPRYETLQAQRCVPALTERLLALAVQASRLGLGLNVDAEEADRLDLSLDIIEAVFTHPDLARWDGFGVVVQAYGKRAGPVIDWLTDLARHHDRRMMVRLVKGAYWDTEIKLAQTTGLASYPVYRRKPDTDVSYIACVRKLLAARDCIYPQFATHNAHTMAAVLQLAGDDREGFEFQRLHGMGEALHDIVMRTYQSRCRIYAPVGAHEDLLAYLVRRLLENGANSSFVNQIVDDTIAPQVVAADPFKTSSDAADERHPAVPLPDNLYQPWRRNSRGFNTQDPTDLQRIDTARKSFLAPYQVGASLAGDAAAVAIRNPARLGDIVGYVVPASADDVAARVATALCAQRAWQATAIGVRAQALNRAADLFEANSGEIFALLAREAGKTITDAVAELREAVDFLRYYASQASELDTQRAPLGVIACISPWNFPLAIFTGQIAAALVTGNAVVAKPAEQTPLIAIRAVDWLHEAGIPIDVLQLAIGDGPVTGAALTANPDINGVCFTGSTEVARLIDAQLARTAAPDAMFIAETGGLNAMIVDSTALTEQATRDIVISAFQSAGQRCSALRVLYVQKEKREAVLAMLRGAMDALVIGDPLRPDCDVGPVIDAQAKNSIAGYCAARQRAGKVIYASNGIFNDLSDGTFVTPTLVAVDSIADIESEIFGPVLHVASFDAEQIDSVVDAINARGYGLTFGLHSRIDERVQRIVNRVKAGNIYINRNQIGAVVGSQPFGGEGLSGTGPKAGGPHYLVRFTRAIQARGAGTRGVDNNSRANPADTVETAGSVDVDNTVATSHGDGPDSALPSRVSAHVIDEAFAKFASGQWPGTQNRIGILRSVLRGRAPRAMAGAAAIDMGQTLLPGPTGESNRLSLRPVGRVLCLARDPVVLLAHVVQALRAGNWVVAVAPLAREATAFLQAPGIPLAVFDGQVPPDELQRARIDAVAINLPEYPAKRSDYADYVVAVRQALAVRTLGPITRFISGHIDPLRFVVERSVCIDTTAAGGNTELLAAVSDVTGQQAGVLAAD